MTTDLKIISVDEKDVINEFPIWFPRNEWAFKSYLIRHPELFAQDAKFIGFEIHYIDLLFEGNRELYVVEAKCITQDDQNKINGGMSQLQRHCGIASRSLTDKKEIVPILAIMTCSCSISFVSSVYLQYRKEWSSKLNTLEELDNKIEQQKLEFKELKSKINKLSAEHEKLRKIVNMIKNRQSIQNFKFHKRFRQQLQIELKRLKEVSKN